MSALFDRRERARKKEIDPLGEPDVVRYHSSFDRPPMLHMDSQFLSESKGTGVGWPILSLRPIFRALVDRF